MAATLFFQGRGNVYLAARDANGVPGAYNIALCTDSLSLSLNTTPFSHINKCGPVDVEDFRGVKDQSGSINMTFADMADYKFALGVLGTVTALGTAGTVSGEDLPNNILAGQYYFLGGLTGHRAITGLTLTGMVVNTDFTLDAASGRVTFLTDAPAGSPGPQASYGYTDPESVAMFTASTQEFAMRYEFINKADANNPGSYEFYRVRFDPTSNLDLQSDELQIMDLKGSVLADLTKSATNTQYGQFGRRVL